MKKRTRNQNRFKILLLLLLIAIISSLFSFFKKKGEDSLKRGIYKKSSSPPIALKNIIDNNDTKPQKVDSVLMFVPYWTLSLNQNLTTHPLLENEPEKDIAYFGISIDKNGDIKSEPGYNNFDLFLEKISQAAQSRFLTVRMHDESINEKILENTSAQQRAIKNIVSLATDSQFSGVLLDFEHGVIADKGTIQHINRFVEHLASGLHNNNLKLYTAIYGDTFYRKRPYDVKTIGKASDKIVIMAYDFHKSYGEPGPLFPLQKGTVYGYDFSQMLQDFADNVEAEKIIITFGLYGYDWKLGPEGKPLKQAEAITLKQILHKQATCNTCEIKQDETSAEYTMTYIDEEGLGHVIWYETQESIQKKVNMAVKKGFKHIGYWAFGYY